MNYHATVQWMFDQLPFYQNQGRKAFKPGLEKITAFLRYLGNPEDTLNIIHIGGTNGKGSTSHMMASVLQEKGYRVGIYSSPHLIDFRERIKINGHWIEKEAVIAFIEAHQSYILKQQMSFFEISFAMALVYFEKQNPDFVMVEVGMGGRLDATNIVTPILSVITNIGLDHTQYLGTTHMAIALEKAGIIKKEVPVVIGESRLDTRPVFELKAQTKNAPLFFADEHEAPIDWQLMGLEVLYQYNNAHTAYWALKQLKSLTISKDEIFRGFRQVVGNTQFMGRWQTLAERPKTIVDVSHNMEGLRFVAQALQKLSFNKLHLVVGFVNDKDVGALLSILPKDACYYLCAPDLFRAFPLDNLEQIAQKRQLNYQRLSGVWQAYEAARKVAAKEDLILVTGSTFVVAEVLEKINQQ